MKFCLHKVDFHYRIRSLIHEEFDKFAKKPRGKKEKVEASYPTIGSVHLKIKASGEATGNFDFMTVMYSVH